jgi:hypothetical protein
LQWLIVQGIRGQRIFNYYDGYSPELTMGAALRRKHGGAHALMPGRYTPDGGGCAVAHVQGAMHERNGTTNGV